MNWLSEHTIYSLHNEEISPVFAAIIIYFTALGIWYTILLIFSFPEVLKKFRESKFGNIVHLINNLNFIPITIVTPAFNEEKRILNMLYSILNSDYKNVKMIVVNDGSTDRTLEFLINEFALYEIPPVIKQTFPTAKIKRCFQSKRFPNLKVLDKEHSPDNCAADSVNAGLNACTTPIMFTIDADTVVEPQALTRMLFTFLSRHHCVAVSGSVYVINGNTIKDGVIKEIGWPKKYIAAVQTVEYLRSFLYGRAGLNVFGGAMCYPGAFTLFETELLYKIGGYDTVNFAYDAEITTKIHHWMGQRGYHYNLNHTPNAFSWTEVPGSLKSFWNQRNKWQRGMWRSALRHMGMFFNPRYKTKGLISFPCYIFFEVLGPVIEFISYLIFIGALLCGNFSVVLFLWFIFLAWGYVTFLSIAMVFLNLISFNKYHKPADTFRVFFLVFADMLWFRQFRALCCFSGTLHYFFNRLLGKPL